MVAIRRARGRPRLGGVWLGGAWLGAASLALGPSVMSDAAWAQASQTSPPHAATPSSAPPPPSPSDDEGEPDATASTVTVTGKRLPTLLPGAVVGDIKPEESLSPADVQSYGVSTVTELLDELAPETRSDRGRGGETPVVLLNGRRISSFSEIQNIPTEAILRVDILPEEVSLKYGYTADQRVVNIVLRRRFRAITGEAIGGGATEGGREQGQAEIDQLRIHGDSRLNLDLKYTGSSQITDASRGIVEQTPGAPYSIPGNVTSATPGGQIDPALSALAGQPVTVAAVPQVSGRALTLGDFAGTAGQTSTTDIGNDRTLSPATQAITANGVLALPIPLGLRATINGTLGATSSNSLQGLPSVGLDVPTGDPFSPFSQPVVVDRYGASPLRQETYGWTAHLGSTLNRDLSDWRLSLTDAYDHAQTWTDTDTGIDATALNAELAAGSPTFNPFAPFGSGQPPMLAQNTADQVTDGLNIQALANGPLFKLPAGPLYVSAKTGDTQSWLASNSDRFGLTQAVDLSRNDVNAQLNVDIPLASDDHHVLGFLGELSANFNAAVDELSDYGVLKAFGYGINWTPIEGYNLIVSHTNDQAAPTITQLGGPIVQTPGVTVFDYATGRTVEVTQISGGEAGLKADNRNVFKVGLTIKPFEKQNLTITANFIKSDIDHPVETFPAADAAIEAAFPDRFERDAEGELEEEDLRPVNFARSERTELRWGFDYSRPIGPQPPPRPFRHHDVQRRPAAQAGGDGGGPPDASGATPASRADGGASGQGTQPGGQTAEAQGDGAGSGGGRGGGGGYGGGRGGFGGGRGRFGPGGRFQIAVYHTIYFVDRMIVSPGGPVLDLLNGSAASSTGGQYRNEIEGQLGATLFGFGGRISADWRSSTSVDAGAGSQTGNLYFSGITTINARLFDNLGQQPWVVRRYPWLRGSRVTLNVLNLFDQRISVKDALGETPLGYQPGYLDPVGRTVTLSLRKLFF
jgi:iron complex outermembrane receptor protein